MSYPYQDPRLQGNYLQQQPTGYPQQQQQPRQLQVCQGSTHRLVLALMLVYPQGQRTGFPQQPQFQVSRMHTLTLEPD